MSAGGTFHGEIMDTKQSEAQRLADAIKASGQFTNLNTLDKAADELRILDAENESLRASFDTLRTGYDAARLEIESLRTDHMQALTAYQTTVENLEAQLAAMGAGGVESLMGDPDALARKGCAIDEQYAHKLALELECMLIDPDRNWDSAAKVLDAYKQDWDEVNPRPPTFMGEPVPPERKAIYAAIRAKRAAIAAQQGGA